MNTSTHPTPGPWCFDTKRGAIATSAGESVAVVCFHGADSLAQENANGHLIAAAPDLLAALRELLADAVRSGLEGRPAVLLARAALLLAGTDHHAGVPATPPRQWLRLPQVCALTTAGKSWLFERMKDQTDPFPAGVRLSSSRLTIWDAEQVSAWMARRTTKAAPATD
ncbi:helix-turn-helix transcriptional regulator [Sphaerotilus sp.]|uniref:helix-turn-helix transcriptional regulator n=1 Tax=Sphaerotilus sp. TaxID=2093942 RepID=UPI0025FD3461|nr:AlpA family phage regulatory protein [Sphaerotilus sp.]